MPKEEKEIIDIHPDILPETEYNDLVKSQDIVRRNIIGSIFKDGGKIKLGTGDQTLKFQEDKGLWLGKTNFSEAPFKVDMEGRINAKRLTLENFINDDDSSITYTGTWVSGTVGILYGATRTESNTVGDYFVISFFGTSIGLILERASTLGKLTIYIDNVEITTVDLYSTTYFSRSVIWQKTDLENKNHTLKGVVALKNVDADDNKVGLQGYTLFPHEGIKMEQLSCDLYAYGVSLTTDANGYVKTVISTPTGYSVYCVVGMKLSETIMSDATTGDPKLAWRATELYLYNGAASTSYVVSVTLLISKI